ncbi:MAG TPA: hypothetical protein VH189_03660 [Rhizomicrobium sp.]|nr:hypothetical protein [Rhizomicrobium sp.]
MKPPAVILSGGRSSRMAERLEHDLTNTDIRSMLDWIPPFRVALTAFPSEALVNLNTPAEWEACRSAAA